MKPEKQLYQWDVNQYLTGINPAAQYVDYTIGNEVIRLETDGTRCRIPDEVLQTYGGKTCYERYPDGTYRAYSFNVLYAPKPPDYVYTPEEHTTFEALTARADAAIEEIKRRADSGEFTPVKGVDYFTDAEKNELMESVSSGAVGEFRKVVDSATTEYNANAAEKLTTYDTNAEQHTTDYNRNAAEKLEAYNSNHAAKVAEYNANAETKTAEFDANAAALQTEVDRLRGECDNLAAENRKQENRISALMKLNKGQTYDILPEEGETASRTAPSGAKYVSMDKVGGKSLVWSQLVDGSNLPTTKTINGITFTNNGDGSITVDGTATENANLNLQRMDNTTIIGHKYLMLGGAAGGSISTYFYRHDSDGGTQAYDFGNGAIFTKTAEGNTHITIRVTSGVTVSGITFKPQLVDLTLMFGAGNEPTIEEFKAMFPADYYPYSEPTIISSQTDMVDVRGRNLLDLDNVHAFGYYSNGEFSPNSSYKCYSIPVKGGAVYTRYQSVLASFAGIISFWDNGTFISQINDNSLVKTFETPTNCTRITVVVKVGRENNNLMVCAGEHEYSPYSLQQITTGFPVLNSAGSVYDYIDLNEGKLYTWTYIEGNEVKALTDPVITDIDIPTELKDWLTVETGGSITFHNTDETKQLPVPNAVSWVRKLNEVE